MKTHLGHLVFHIDPENAGFYKDLFEFLAEVDLRRGGAGVTNGGECALWFEGEAMVPK